MIEDLFKKKYDPQNYHCVHFVIDAALDIYKLDYKPCFIGLTGSINETIKTSRDTAHRNKNIDAPIDGCIVLMTKYDNGSHVGLYYKHRVFHLTEDSVQRLTIEQIKLQYKRIRFYEPNLLN